MVTDSLFEELELEKVSPSIIMVAGIGGAGGNAVNRMHDFGIGDVSFIVCNTDRQALNMSPIPIKVQLGEGLGAGNKPERGRIAAIESLEKIVDIFSKEGTKMLFVTAGMGGGTGTGAAPIIAKAARESGILTVGIVTMPYQNEGPERTRNALLGIEELKKGVDSLIIINNENIKEIYGKLPITEAFGKANDVLATAARSIAEIITRTAYVNVDFADVCTVMRDSGISLMGTGRASGEDRAQDSVESALLSPLLNHNSISGATNILLNITYGSSEATLDETDLIRNHIIKMAGGTANIIWGAGNSDLLDDELEVTIVATGFKNAVEEPSQGGKFPGVGGEALGGNAIWNSPRSGLGSPFTKPTLPSQGGGVTQGQGDSIQFTDDRKRYEDIETILNSPAYVRRKVKLVQDVAKVEDTKRSAAKTVDVADGSHRPDTDGTSLFDQVE